LDYEVKKELQIKLQKEFPLLFERLGGKESETCMSWRHGGIAINDGWYNLFAGLCSAMTEHIEEHDDCSQVVFEQVKEKFGRLRIYFSGGDSNIRSMINMAESVSGHICENCGDVGDLRTNSGWIHVSCNKCFQKDKMIYEDD